MLEKNIWLSKECLIVKSNGFYNENKKYIQSIENIKSVPERIKQARLYRGFTISDFADEIDVSRQSVHSFENGSKYPSSTTVGKIINLTNFPLSFFTKHLPASNDIVVNYRSFVTTRAMVKEIVNVFSEFVEEYYLYLREYIDYPKPNLPEIPNIIPGKIDHELIEDIACNLRTYWNAGFGPISNVVRLMEKNGVIITRLPFGDLKVDACSYWSNNERPILLLSSDKKCAVRNRFDAAHELGHLLLHKSVRPELNFDKNFMKSLEIEANRFAGAFLLPYKSFPNEFMSTSLRHLVSLKECWKVSIGAIIYRCHDLSILTDENVLNIRKRMATKKMLTREPLDDVLEPENPVILKKSIDLLIERKLKSVQGIINDLCMFVDDIENIACLPCGTLAYDEKIIPLIRLKKDIPQ